MTSMKWRAAAAPLLALVLAACESGDKAENGTAKTGDAPAASGGYEWIIKAREAEASDPKAAPDAMAKGGKEAIPFLVWQLTSDDTPAAMKAADAFVVMGGDSVAILDRIVRSKAAHGRNWAIWALGKIGAAAKPVAAGIKEAGKEPAFRQVAAEALKSIEK